MNFYNTVSSGGDVADLHSEDDALDMGNDHDTVKAKKGIL